ncbi:MAG: TraR/DksA family transcriptional regulator [Nitrospirae bacterium]|nr:TraR/DksA family transcriptional regulator [Nitrospirota bacterium]
MKEREAKFEAVRRKLTKIQKDLYGETKVEIDQAMNKGDEYNGVSDDGDLADIAFRDSLLVAKFTRHQTRLKAIEEALRRIDEGLYGICEDCGEEISVARLNAVPFALRCIDCQERHEAVSAESAESVAQPWRPSD